MPLPGAGARGCLPERWVNLQPDSSSTQEGVIATTVVTYSKRVGNVTAATFPSDGGIAGSEPT
jgi:hypothetical protein